MSDPKPRADVSRAGDSVPEPGRDTKIEELLLAGLDHYFAGRYEHAISVWTRVLFIDRAHARARAYIERARGALAERQRESEELLQYGVDAYERGEEGEARRLLRTAVEGGAPSDEAWSLLNRLDRMDQWAVVSSRGSTPKSVPARAELSSGLASHRSRTVRRGVVLGVAALIAAASIGLLMVDWIPEPPAALSPPLRVTGEYSTDLALPRRAERALTRAQTLAASGRLRDALLALDDVRATDEEKPAADQLRSTIQRELLEIRRASGATEAGTVP